MGSPCKIETYDDGTGWWRWRIVDPHNVIVKDKLTADEAQLVLDGWEESYGLDNP